MRESQKNQPAVTTFQRGAAAGQRSRHEPQRLSAVQPQPKGNGFNRKERKEHWLCRSALFAVLFLKVMFSCAHFFISSQAENTFEPQRH
jgi:hypothetical protein